jgi:hypothetical protein
VSDSKEKEEEGFRLVGYRGVEKLPKRMPPKRKPVTEPNAMESEPMRCAIPIAR